MGRSRTNEGGARPSPEDARRDIGVVLVEPLHVVRAGLRLLVASQPDMQVVGEAAGGEETLELLEGLARRRDVVVLVALSLSGAGGAYSLIRTIRERAPSLPIVALGGNADDTAISRALFAGADGFIDKGAAPDAFLSAVRRTLDGETVLEGVPGDWLGPIAYALERQRQFAPFLTERELQVLAAAAEGLTARQMGRRLGIQERTITTHLTRIYGKLGVSGRTAAVRAAATSGLVALGALE
jgi:DNA-binding NarL/FixJ family response regulator